MTQKSQTNTQQPLTNPRWEKFAQLVASGKSETDAYYETYKTKNKVSAKANGNRLMTNAIVRVRVRELQEENAKRASLSREESQNILSEIARDSQMGARDRISAIAELNRMNGWNKEKENSAVADSIVINLGTFMKRND